MSRRELGCLQRAPDQVRIALPRPLQNTLHAAVTDAFCTVMTSCSSSFMQILKGMEITMGASGTP